MNCTLDRISMPALYNAKRTYHVTKDGCRYLYVIDYENKRTTLGSDIGMWSGELWNQKIIIPMIVEFNVDDPRSSIDRLMKLQLLK